MFTHIPPRLFAAGRATVFMIQRTERVLEPVCTGGTPRRERGFGSRVTHYNLDSKIAVFQVLKTAPYPTKPEAVPGCVEGVQ